MAPRVKSPRPALLAVLVCTAPLVLLTVALPVGFVMELGKQAVVVVENATDRPLRVTPLGNSRGDDRLRVLPRTWHPLLPLPAFRTTDLDLAPGASRRVVYSARQARPSALAVREADGALGYLAFEPALRPTIRIAGRPPAALDPIAGLIERDSPAFRWLMLLAGPLGTVAFVAAWRARGRLPTVG
jgi:hypothetical protein